MRRSPKRLAALVAALLLVLPGVTAAQEPGVTIDDGPSSKEYAIPLDSARGQTKPKPKPKPTSTPAPATTTTRTTTAPSASKTTTTRTETKTQTEPAAPASTTPDPPVSSETQITSRPTADTSSDGTSAGVVIAGLAVAAIVLGVLAGLVIRRRRTPIDGYDAG